MSTVTYLRQDVDYLGFLESQLRGLGGIDTMVYELIQNADDVHTADGQPGATSITLDVRDDALVIGNDGVFREEDFRRMQRIAGGAKRYEADTTGAFGIGFISVYQVTDAPEILSAGRHWVIHPEETDADRRIHETLAETSKTVFRLPWADDPRSAVRQGLRLDPVDHSKLDEMTTRIAEAVCGSALFLRQIERMDVLRNGEPVQIVRRGTERANGTLDLFLSGRVINDVQSWTIYDLDFHDRAAQLRRQHPVQVEAVRRERVQLAVCKRPSQTGRLYATLPTNTTFDLPFCINADFYPTPDRKAILFGEDYQGAWNRAAIETAATGLEEHLEAIRDLFGAVSFVGMLDRTERLHAATDDRKPDRSFNAFWDALAPTLSGREIVCTLDGTWMRPAEARLLQGEAELKASELVSQLGLKVVSRDLSRYANILTHRFVGTPLLSIRDIVDLLDSHGVQAEMRLDSCPEPLLAKSAWVMLWNTLEELLDPNRLQRNSTRQITELSRLEKAPIAMDQFGRLREPKILRSADKHARALFPNAPFLSEDLQEHALFKQLVPKFGPRDAIAHLHDLGPDLLESSWCTGELDLGALYAWFSQYASGELAIQNVARDFRKLCIWPSSARLLSIDELYLPTGFRDPLGIATLVDTELIEGHVDLARRMGMKTLDFRTYALEVVPAWLGEHPNVDVTSRRALIRLLAEHRGQIEDDREAKRRLSGLRLIECTDGSYSSASEVYVDNEHTRLLGERARVAAHWYKDLHSIHNLYSWLGIADEPRPEALVACIRDVVQQARDEKRTRWIGKVIEYLSKRWLEFDETHRRGLDPLRYLRWLPGTRDGTIWYLPTELYAVFTNYLFASQGNFLDLPRQTQNDAAAFIAWLRVKHEPSTDLVVRHLIHCSDQSIPVNAEVYGFLNQKADEPEVQRLRGKTCILTSRGEYINPHHAFWRENPYGEYRITLSSEENRYRKLFDLIGVRDGPEDQDHIDVLLDVSAKFGQYNHVLDVQSRAVVVRCWQMLSGSIRQEVLDPGRLGELRQRKVAVNRDGYLAMPDWLYMEDRPHIAEHFREVLGPTLIARPADAWSALHAAGVRRLSEATKLELLEPIDDTDDPELADRYRERLRLIERVIEGVRQDTDVQKVESLGDLRFSTVSSIKGRYALHLPSRWQHSEPVSLSVFVEQSRFMVASNGVMPWTAIARELAYLLKPDGEITSLAPGLKEALAYDTLEEASQALDQMAIPPLAEPSVAVKASSPVQTVESQPTEVGQEEEDCLPENEKESSPPVPDGGLKSVYGYGSDKHSRGGSDSGSTGESFGIQGSSDRKGGSHQGATGDGSGGSSSTTETKPEAITQHKVRKRSEERLMSYVIPIGDTSAKADAVRAERLRDVEQAGIKVALEHEEQEGRKPEEQGHQNPGYDIVSREAGGSRRYIEVKALSGTWDSRNPVRMTPAEMEAAQSRGQTFWLYVVEHALQSNWVLYRIQDPAGRVYRHCFDHGWIETAEVSTASSPADPPTAD